MENPLVPAVLDNLPLLLDNPDLAQSLLHRAIADLQRNNALALQAAVCLLEGLRLEAELRTLPARTEDQRLEHAVVVVLLAGLVDSVESLSKQQWMLIRLVGLLVVVRAAASARSRAGLLPGLLLAAVSAAVVVYVSTGGAVVPGFRSFVRFSLLMLGFIFASDRPPAPGRRGG